MSDRFVDFDAAWAEITAADDPPRMKVRGEVVDLPPSMPAKVVLYQARNRDRLEGKNPAPEAVVEMAGMVFGSERLDGWISDGMEWRAIYISFLLAQGLIYRRRSDEGEAPPPATGDSSTTSSPDGSPSKATSPASTDGT